MIDKPVADGGKPIKSEKDFVTEASELCLKLKDTQTCDWKTRTVALKRIQYFAKFYRDSGVAQGSSCVSFSKFYEVV